MGSGATFTKKRFTRILPEKMGDRRKRRSDRKIPLDHSVQFL